MRVGIFGAWRAVDGDPIYTRTRDYAHALATSGYDVVTGGYAGVMEAANRGAAEAGGKSVGITCPEIDRLLPVNCWVNDHIKEVDLPARLAACFRGLHAAVFLPGRSGTITELSLALEMREKKLLPNPVFLTCEYWVPLLAVHKQVNSVLTYPSSGQCKELFYLCKSPADLIAKMEAS